MRRARWPTRRLARRARAQRRREVDVAARDRRADRAPRARWRSTGGTPPTMRRRELAMRIAVVAQKPTVPEGATVLDYVLARADAAHPLLRVGRPARSRRRGGGARGARPVRGGARGRSHSLSGGEAQRVFVARALAQEPSLLLLDEPTTSLDVGRQQEVLELIERLRRDRGVTVVSALHDLSLAGQFADRLLLLHEGNQVAEGPPGEVLTEQVVREFFGASVRLVPDRRIGARARAGAPARRASTRRGSHSRSSCPRTSSVRERRAADLGARHRVRSATRDRSCSCTPATARARARRRWASRCARSRAAGACSSCSS